MEDNEYYARNNYVSSQTQFGPSRGKDLTKLISSDELRDQVQKAILSNLKQLDEYYGDGNSHNRYLKQCDSILQSHQGDWDQWRQDPNKYEPPNF